MDVLAPKAIWVTAWIEQVCIRGGFDDDVLNLILIRATNIVSYHLLHLYVIVDVILDVSLWNPILICLLIILCVLIEIILRT